MREASSIDELRLIKMSQNRPPHDPVSASASTACVRGPHAALGAGGSAREIAGIRRVANGGHRSAVFSMRRGEWRVFENKPLIARMQHTTETPPQPALPKPGSSPSHGAGSEQRAAQRVISEKNPI